MSCLFDSLAVVLGGDSAKLRAEACAFLEKNPDLNGIPAADCMGTNTTLEKYVAAMRHPSTWGSAIEIKAICDARNVAVTVIVARTGKQVEFLPDGEKPTRQVAIKWTGNHYTPAIIGASQPPVTRLTPAITPGTRPAPASRPSIRSSGQPTVAQSHQIRQANRPTQYVTLGSLLAYTFGIRK